MENMSDEKLILQDKYARELKIHYENYIIELTAQQ